MLSKPWVLAIDFGTSFTVAAAAYQGEHGTVVEIDGERRLPSVILVDGDDIIVGRVADEMSSARPGDVLRAPKNRLGDQGAVVLAGKTFPASRLVAAILQGVYGCAVREYGTEPLEVRLCHPATWTRTKLSKLLDAASQAGLPDSILVPEPVAAALSYWQRGELQPGEHVAIYDLGGGTFDTAMLQTVGEGFHIIGRPEGDQSLGGELFDEILVQIIGEKLDPALWEDIQLAQDETWIRIASVLRAEARRAKETMSSYRYAEALVPAPTGIVRVRVERAEFEERIQPHLNDSTSLLRRCITEAGLSATDVALIQLVGGSSRIPAVETTLHAAFPNTTLHRRGDPKSAVALGALLAGELSVTPRPSKFGSSEEVHNPPPVVTPPVPPVPSASPRPAPPAGPVNADAAPIVAPPPPPPSPPPQSPLPAASSSDDSSATRIAEPPRPLVDPSWQPPGPPEEEGSGNRIGEEADGGSRSRAKRPVVLVVAAVVIAILSARTHAVDSGDYDTSILYGAWPSDLSTLLLAVSPLLVLAFSPSTMSRSLLIGITVGYAVVLDGALYVWDFRYYDESVSPAWLALKILLTAALVAACWLPAPSRRASPRRAGRAALVLIVLGSGGLIAFAFLRGQFVKRLQVPVSMRAAPTWQVLLTATGVIAIVSAAASRRWPIVRPFCAGVALAGGLYAIRLTTVFVEQPDYIEFSEYGLFGLAGVAVSALLIVGSFLYLRAGGVVTRASSPMEPGGGDVQSLRERHEVRQHR